MLNGNQWKGTILASEIPDGWKPVKIGINGQQNPLDALMPMLMFSSGNSENTKVTKILQLAELSWTDGEWRTIDGDAYLVTYKFDLNLSELADMHSATKMLSPRLKLHLVRKSAISSLTPDSELTKEEFVKTIAPLATTLENGNLSAKKASTLSNMKQISLGMLMYMGDYDDVLPYAQGTEAARYVTYPYIKNASIWQSLNPNGSEFYFNTSIGGANEIDILSPALTVLYYESKVWPDGTRAVAFLDGHVKFLDPEAWAEAAKTLSLKIKKKAKPLPMNYGVGKVPVPGAQATPPPYP